MIRRCFFPETFVDFPTCEARKFATFNLEASKVVRRKLEFTSPSENSIDGQSGETQSFWMDGDFKYCLFSSLLGEDSHFDEHIFQRGWNHELGRVRRFSHDIVCGMIASEFPVYGKMTHPWN